MRAKQIRLLSAAGFTFALLLTAQRGWLRKILASRPTTQ
jgi:hypothetical protein